MNPSRAAVNIFIGINLIVFLAWRFASDVQLVTLARNFVVSWELACELGRPWTLLTAVFSHNALVHFLINMFVLNSFGSLIEGILGTRRFVVFYLAAGVVSSLVHCVVSNFILGEPGLAAIGASGAVAGLVLVFALMFPKEKLLLFGLLPLPALFGALVFVGLDIWGLVAQAEGGGLPIGHGAHLGGAFTGALYYVFYVRPRWRAPR